MNIVREQREQNTSLIKVTVGEQDYAQEVDKALREYKRKANVPGFRPGMVPMSLIRKMYGKGVLAEQSYRKASNSVFEYLQKENIDYLGDVIPSEEQGDFDFENGTEFEFVFEIGEAPEIKLELSDKDKLTYHKIKVDKKMHEDYRSNFLRRFGRLVDAEKVSSDEALTVTLDNGEMKVEDAYVGLISMSEEERKPFVGKKVGFKTKVNVNELYKNPSQRAACLQVKEHELEGINPEFELEITKIRKFAEPELNEEFFKMAFPAGNVKTAEEFEKFIDAQIESELRRGVPQALALHHQRGQVHDGGDREGFRPVPQDVHVELPPEALHQGRQPLGEQGGGRGRSQGAGRRAVRAVRHAVGSRGHACRLRREDSRRQGAGAEDLREALRDEGRRGREVEGQGDGEVRLRRRFRQAGAGALARGRRSLPRPETGCRSRAFGGGYPATGRFPPSFRAGKTAIKRRNDDCIRKKARNSAKKYLSLDFAGLKFAKSFF